MEWKKVEVTTECPMCKQPYTRLEYEKGLFAGMVLDICEKCIPQEEVPTIEFKEQW